MDWWWKLFQGNSDIMIDSCTYIYIQVSVRNITLECLQITPTKFRGSTFPGNMHNYIWCPYYLPSFMKFCSVVSEELRWQTVWRTDRQTDGLNKNNTSPHKSGRRHKYIRGCLTFFFVYILFILVSGPVFHVWICLYVEGMFLPVNWSVSRLNTVVYNKKICSGWWTNVFIF